MLSGQLFTSSSQHVSITSAFDTEYLPTSTIETGQRYILQFRFMMAMMAIMAMMVIADANAIPLTIDIYWLMVLHRALRSPAVICASAGAEWHQATNLQGSKDQISQCTTTHNDSHALHLSPTQGPRGPRGWPVGLHPAAILSGRKHQGRPHLGIRAGLGWNGKRERGEHDTMHRPFKDCYSTNI